MKTILICPLNWGLGHASRVMVIARELNDAGYRIILGADKAALDFLHAELPDLEIIRIRDISVRYSRWLPAWVAILASFPLIVYSIVREHYLLKKIITDLQPDMLISDNRYGLWNKKIINVIITHQLSPSLPVILRMFKGMLNKIIHRAILKFDYCWVPDQPGAYSLSGLLSQITGKHPGMRYAGYLSRFSSLDIKPPARKSRDLMIIVSGPEPQRSVFLNIILEQIRDIRQKTLIVSGDPGKGYSYEHTPNCRIVSHLPDRDFLAELMSSEYVISRAGYSTIMDLVVTGKKALLVPTPGQPEQEYLAAYLQEKGLFPYCLQRGFSVSAALQIMDKYRYNKVGKVSAVSFRDLVEEHCKGY